MSDDTFRVIGQEGLIREIDAVFSTSPTPVPRKVEEASREQALNLSIGEITAVITIASGAITLAEKCIKLIEALHRWLSGSKKESTKIVIQGAFEDRTIVVTQKTTAKTLEVEISRTTAKPKK